MPRQNLIECLIGADRLVAPSVTVLETGIGIDKPQRALLAVVGGLEALRRLRHVVGKIGDERCMIVAERAEPLILKAVDLSQGALVVARARIGPSGQQRRGDVSLASGATFRQAVPGGGILALL